MALDRILIKGAREHNLKDIDLEIPRNKIVVITGISGSGKSSLTFDTLYAEGQRQYLESLSTSKRQFLEKMKRPNVEYIEGLSPVISIENKGISRNPRSTVGTLTEIYDYLRLLFATVGKPHCFYCGKEIIPTSPQEIVDELLLFPIGSKIEVFSPLKADYGLERLRKDGYSRVRLKGGIRDLDEDIIFDEKKEPMVEVFIDSLLIKEGVRHRLTDSLEIALNLSKGIVKVGVGEREILYSEKPICIDCNANLPEITPTLFSFNDPHGACLLCGGLGIRDGQTCPSCKGNRLRRESLAIKVGGLSISEIGKFSIKEALKFFSYLTLTPKEREISRGILKEVSQRLELLADLGLDYLTLSRPSTTLSRGEAQQIRLATQIGSGLVGVLYILDEPSVGLHPRDNIRLLNSLRKLRDLGNTVLVVEHDPYTILGADWIIDMGPGAGNDGGRVVFKGTSSQILGCKESLTGKYLSKVLEIPTPKSRRKPNERFLIIKGASENNLKNIEVKIPLGLFTCITGVSGSGKSTLAVDILYRALTKKLYHSKERVGRALEIQGLEYIDGVVEIAQNPLSKSAHSNVATYTGIFTVIRELFSQIPEARARGYGRQRFSFNEKGGRCEACRGDGVQKIDMHFLPDVYVTCELCNGKRYDRETLEIRYKGKNISDILEMTVREGLGLFERIPRIREKLLILSEIGIDYIILGQSLNTFSGGEAQRIRLARQLSRKAKGETLYILDEPTTGLHFAEIQRLLKILNRLIDSGNTVLVIEHNLEVIKSADFIIDLGPEGGDKGGKVIAMGTPEAISKVQGSYTAQFLREIL